MKISIVRKYLAAICIIVLAAALYFRKDVLLWFDPSHPHVGRYYADVDYTQTYTKAISNPRYKWMGGVDVDQIGALDEITVDASETHGTVRREFYLIRFPSAKKTSEIITWMSKHGLKPASGLEMVSYFQDHLPEEADLSETFVALKAKEVPVNGKSEKRFLFLECTKIMMHDDSDERLAMSPTFFKVRTTDDVGWDGKRYIGERVWRAGNNFVAVKQ